MSAVATAPEAYAENAPLYWLRRALTADERIRILRADRLMLLEERDRAIADLKAALSEIVRLKRKGGV